MLVENQRLPSKEIARFRNKLGTPEKNANANAKTNTNTMKVATEGSQVTSIRSQGGRNEGDNAVKRKIRILKTMVNYLMIRAAVYFAKEYPSAGAVYFAKEYPSADLLPVTIKSSVPICFGVVVNSTLGLIVEGDSLDVHEGLTLGLKGYTIILATLKRVEAYYVAVVLATLKRVEAYYVAVVFLLLCGGFCCSNQIVRLTFLFITYIGAVRDLTCSIMSSIGTLYGWCTYRGGRRLHLLHHE